ncbi:MAG: hypothetical protein PHE43_03020 [Candidatus Nanoarchaeia archaeon]|nr:hypothetical protein [Candidatus Nanoarchaeia archaeon]
MRKIVKKKEYPLEPDPYEEIYPRFRGASILDGIILWGYMILVLAFGIGVIWFLVDLGFVCTGGTNWFVFGKWISLYVIGISLGIMFSPVLILLIWVWIKGMRKKKEEKKSWTISVLFTFSEKDLKDVGKFASKNKSFRDSLAVSLGALMHYLLEEESKEPRTSEENVKKEETIKGIQRKIDVLTNILGRFGNRLPKGSPRGNVIWFV